MISRDTAPEWYQLSWRSLYLVADGFAHSIFPPFLSEVETVFSQHEVVQYPHKGFISLSHSRIIPSPSVPLWRQYSGLSLLFWCRWLLWRYTFLQIVTDMFRIYFSIQKVINLAWQMYEVKEALAYIISRMPRGSLSSATISRISTDLPDKQISSLIAI